MRAFLRFLAALPRSVLLAFVIYLPGDAGVLLRRWYYGRRLRACGRNLTVMPGVHIGGERYIEIGDDVTIRENAVIRAGGKPASADTREIIEFGSYVGRERGVIRIGDRARIAFGVVILGYGGVAIGRKCGIGPHCILLSETFHHKGRDPRRIYKYSQGADPDELCVLRGFVELLDGAGIASNVIVLPGATVGRDAWVGPNSIVRVGGVIANDVIAKGDPAGNVIHRHYVVRHSPDDLGEVVPK
jgi:acetyltransferase-like isoleucine patch superfamily enzyme